MCNRLLVCWMFLFLGFLGAGRLYSGEWGTKGGKPKLPSYLLYRTSYYTSLNVENKRRERLPRVLFFDPFQNKLYSWDGKQIVNQFDKKESLAGLEKHKIGEFSVPVAWEAGKFVVATSTTGKIIEIDIKKGSVKTLYHSKGKCDNENKFDGCIYTVNLVNKGEVRFLEHRYDVQRRVEVDYLYRLEQGKKAQLLVEDVPSPSGPLWIRPNGNVGLLPYKQGIYEIKVSDEKQLFKDAKESFSEFKTAGQYAQEGWTSEWVKYLGVFDFGKFKVRREAGKEIKVETVVETVASAFDPCSGQLGYLDKFGRAKLYWNKEMRVPLVPPNSQACPWIVEWSLESKKGETGSGKAIFSAVQGYPSGTPVFASTLVYSIGKDGEVELKSSKEIVAVEGVEEIRVFENAFEYQVGGSDKKAVYQEPAKIEVYDTKNDRWVSVGKYTDQVTHSRVGSGILPWTKKAGGFGIDLSKFEIESTNKIRIRDLGNGGLGGAEEKYGFDLDAIVVHPDAIKASE